MKLFIAFMSSVVTVSACWGAGLDACWASNSTNYDSATGCPSDAQRVSGGCGYLNETNSSLYVTLQESLDCNLCCFTAEFLKQFHYNACGKNYYNATGKFNSTGQCPSDTALGCGSCTVKTNTNPCCGCAKLQFETALCSKCPLGSPCAGACYRNTPLYNYVTDTLCARKVQTLCPCPCYVDRLECGNGDCPATCSPTGSPTPGCTCSPTGSPTSACACTCSPTGSPTSACACTTTAAATLTNGAGSVSGYKAWTLTLKGNTTFAPSAEDLTTLVADFKKDAGLEEVVIPETVTTVACPDARRRQRRRRQLAEDSCFKIRVIVELKGVGSTAPTDAEWDKREEFAQSAVGGDFLGFQVLGGDLKPVQGDTTTTAAGVTTTKNVQEFSGAMGSFAVSATAMGAAAAAVLLA